jgi:hypothetical protein
VSSLSIFIMEAPDINFLERQLRNKLGESTFDEILQYVKDRKPKLWGDFQEDPYQKNMVICTLAKFSLGWSYDRLIKIVHVEPHLVAKSLNYNVLALARVLSDWGKEWIIWGTRREWKDAARRVKYPAEFGDVLMWIDSSDFPIIRRKGRGAKSDWWSGKEGRPCRRYLFLSTADGVIRKVWPAYSPKRYDSDKVRDHRDFFDTFLKDVVVIGDNHFLAAKNYLRRCKILAPTTERDPPKRKADRQPGAPGEKEIGRNKKIRRLRARVETPFATLSNKFDCLSTPFYEDIEVHDEIVYFAAGVHNYIKHQNE